MYTLKNKVQLIGTVTNIPKIEILENNKKQATIILATTEKCKNEKGKRFKTEVQVLEILLLTKTSESPIKN